MDLFIVVPYIIAFPCLIASMMKKIIQGKEPTLECAILALGGLAIYFLFFMLLNS